MTDAGDLRLGIDIGGSRIKAVAMRGDAVIAQHTGDPYQQPTLDALTSALRCAVDTLGTDEKPSRVGVAVAGVLNEQGQVIAAANLGCLVGQDLGAWLHDTLALPSVPGVVTDSLAAARAEHRAQPISGRALYLSIGTGVGGVVLDDGEPIQITRGTPGHLGHIDVSGGEADPPRDGNGAVGTLEAYLGTDRFETALVRALRTYLAIYRPDEIVLLGGRGMELAERCDELHTQTQEGISIAAPPRWVLRCGTLGPYAAAIGAAHAGHVMSDAAALPPDRAHVLTEQRNSRSTTLHEMSTRDVVELINSEDGSVARAVADATDTITAFIESAEPRFSAGGRLIYLGAGTSGRLGVLDASEMPPTFQTDPDRVVGLIAGGDRSLRRSSEGLEDDPRGAHAALDRLNLTEHDSVLGIAAGGTTPYVLGGLTYAKRVAPGVNAGLLSCSPIEQPTGVDHLIVAATGPELVTGSTRMKAGTATKLVLNTISTTLMVRTGRVYENLMVDVRATNAKLRDRAARIITTLTGLGRDEAFDLLDRADGEVKTAIVMHRLSLDADAARDRLDEHAGRVAEVLRQHHD